MSDHNGPRVEGWGVFPYKGDQDAHRKIYIKALRETNVGVAQS